MVVFFLFWITHKNEWTNVTCFIATIKRKLIFFLYCFPFWFSQYSQHLGLISYCTSPVRYASLRVAMPTVHLHSNWDVHRHNRPRLSDQIRWSLRFWKGHLRWRLGWPVARMYPIWRWYFCSANINRHRPLLLSIFYGLWWKRI